MGVVTEVHAIVMDRAGRTLMGREGEEKWGTPGGEILTGEHLLESIIRQVYEHSGVHIEPQHVMFVSEAIDVEQDSHRILIYVFAKYKDSGTLAGCVWDELKWVDVRELGDIQDELSDDAIDAYYKFSLVLQQSAGKL